MDYAVAAAAAPAGWRHFTRDDFDRLPEAVRRHELARVPAADALRLEAADPSAEERFVRAEFWTLVYHLEPERWDALAQVEPVSPELVRALPRVQRALDIGAGSGRLTRHLAKRSESVVAIEPSLGLIRLLRARMPRVDAIAGWAEALPVADGWSQLTAACGAFGPDPEVLSELERVTCHGGAIALMNPEEPEWFQAHGWERYDFEAAPTPQHDHSIDDFFGPPDPPRVLVMKKI